MKTNKEKSGSKNISSGLSKETPPQPTKELFIGPETGTGENVLKKYLPIIEMVVRKEYKSIPSYLAEYSELINVGLLSVNKLLNEVVKNNKVYNSSYIAQAVKWAIKDELRTKYNWYGVKQGRSKDQREDDYDTHDEMREREHETITEQEATERVFETILSLDDMTREVSSQEQLETDELARLEVLELKAALKRAIDQLPPKHKRVIELRFYEGRRGNDVAAELGVTPSRISHMIQDAIEKVRQYLTKEGFC